MNKNIVIDLDNITKAQVLEWQRGRREILYNDDGSDMVLLDPGELEKFDFNNLYLLVIVAWPYGEMTYENFISLPYGETKLVDQAVSESMSQISKKK